MSEFFAGQKVVCVNASNPPEFSPYSPSENIFEGKIYTIKRIFVDAYNVLIVHLIEVERDAASKMSWGPDTGYRADRFRPLETKAVEIFRKIARDVTEGKKAQIDA